MRVECRLRTRDGLCEFDVAGAMLNFARARDIDDDVLSILRPLMPVRRHTRIVTEYHLKMTVGKPGRADLKVNMLRDPRARILRWHILALLWVTARPDRAELVPAVASGAEIGEQAGVWLVHRGCRRIFSIRVGMK